MVRNADNKKSLPAQCIFCAIAQGSSPADLVHETDQTLFFWDISPRAKVHIVGIPKEHITSLAEVTIAQRDLIGLLLHDIAEVARKVDVEASGYRVITNIGQHAGQIIQHLHVHLLGGEPLGPLRC